MERRAFFKLAGFSAASVAALGALGACEAGGIVDNPLSASAHSDDASDALSAVGAPAVSFSTEVDVLVVGSGVAGLSAAMAPLKAGRSVMIVDKLELLGGESYESNGVICVAGSDVQRRAGIGVTVDEAWEVVRQNLSDAGIAGIDFAKRLFEAAPAWVDALANEYGAQFCDPSAYESSEAGGMILLPKNGLGDMESIMVPLRDALLDAGASFSTDYKATAFIVSDANDVRGVRFSVSKGASTVDVGARRIVIATGGFASSQPLVHRFVPARERVGCYTFASMGEGQALCEALGAQLEGMDVAAPLTSDIPPAAAWGMFGPTLIVDALGHRFAREDDTDAAADACVADERGYWWTVFDEQLVNGSQSRSLAQVTSAHPERLVGPCDDVAALAAKTGIPGETLQSTFARYEAFAADGTDGDFGRTGFLQKLNPPYYAIKQLPVRYKTRGGVRTDEAGRALGPLDAVIPRVYCCGSVAASGIEGIASCGSFGMLVGEAVAASLEEEDA